MKGRYDLVVLGGGTAGLVSSLIAAGTGARVALIERDRTGGDCLWTGCVPSKSLIAAANLAHRMRNADRVGLSAHQPVIDFAAVMERVQAAIATIEPVDSPQRLRSEGVEVIEAPGRFVGPGEIEAGGRRLRFTSALIATGSEPALPPVEGLEGEGLLTTDSVWDLRELPERLVVLGGGPIGCELGQAFARLGSKVTLVELSQRLLGKEEPQVGALIAARLQADGVAVRIGSKAIAVHRASGSASELEVETAGGREWIPFDSILSATGRAPRSQGFGLDRAGVEVDDSGAVLVDDRLRTSNRRIYAIGDVNGRLPFTHSAAHQARIATINALFGTRSKMDETIPWVTFTDPEVGRVGLTEGEARERFGDAVEVSRADYADLDRAIAEGRTDGFALLVTGPKDRLVGATVAAPGGGEAIAELTARVKDGAKIDTVSTTVHAYPTLAEGPSRAADEHLRRRYAGPRYRRLAKVALAARRLLLR